MRFTLWRRHPVAAWVLFGFLLRLALYFHWRDLPVQDDYFDKALKWLHGQPLTTFEDLFRPPLYAWALYGLFRITGPSQAIASVLQCALGAGTGWMLYRMARTLGDEKAGVAAAALWSVNVYSVYYSARLMNETLYVALTVAFFWSWLSSPHWGEGRPALSEVEGVRGLGLSSCAGLLAGAACLCKWTFFGFLPWFAASEGWPVLRRRSSWMPLATCLAAAAVLVGLWGVRNEARYGRFILAGPQKGWNFYEGLALQTAEDPERPLQMAAEAKALGLDQDPFRQDEYFWKKGWREIRDDPKGAALLFTAKAVKFWRLAPYPPHPRALRWAAGLFYLVLFACALQGALIARRRGLRLAPIYALMLYTWLLHTVFFSGLRYRFPLDPFLTLLAGFSLALLFWGDGRSEKPA